MPLTSKVRTPALSGSLTKLTDGTSYLIAGANVTVTTGSSGAVTVSSTATGGGGDTFFSSTTNGSVFTTGSAAFAGDQGIDSPLDAGIDVFFYVSGANDDTSSALFGGSIISSGSYIRLVDTAGTTVAYMDSVGNISGAANIYMGGAFDNIFEGPLNIQGASNTVKFTNNFGNIQGLDWGNGAVTFLHQLNGGVGLGNTVNLYGADLKIENNNISGSSGLNIILGSSGFVETVGDFKVGGNDIQASDGAIAITLTDATGDVSIAGDLTVVGNDIKASDSTTAITLTPATGEVTFAGDISATAATLNLANTTATTVNFAGGASTALNIGNSAGTNTVSGRAIFNQGLSGSLTHLANGSSYLVAGNNVTITTGSSGAVTISSTAAGGDSFFSSTTNGSVFTTGSVAIRGGNSGIDSPADVGSNVFFFVSGSKGTLAAAGVNDSVFGGNLVISGTLKVGTGLEVAEVPSVVTYLDAKNFLNIAAAGGGVDINDGGGVRLLSPTTKIGSSFFNVNVGSDANLFVSGAIGSRSTSTKGTSVFGGDAVVSGTLVAASGITGSLTKLSNGNSYLVAGNNVTITTGSTGAVTISASDTFFSSTTSGSIFTSGSIAIRGGESAVDAPSDKGADVFFYVSGSTSGNTNISLFGGQVVTSGSVRAIGGISGSHTKLSDGTSYLIAGNNVSISTGSNGAVTISSSDSFFSSTTSGSIFTSGSVAIRGGESAVDAPSDKGTDVFFYVSGSTGAGSGVSLFGGNVTTSGSLRAVSSTSTGSFGGNLEVTGTTHLAAISENLVNSVGGTGTVNFNLASQGIFYVNGPTGDITANFQNVPTTNLRVITPTVILSQSSTARIVSAVQIDGAAQTVNWANNLTPVGTSGKQDVFGFSLIRSGSAWKVLGQMSTYG